MATAHEPVPLLVNQHRQMADLFRRTADATGPQRKRQFVRLRRLIAAHETAEELLIHTRVRWADSTGDELARARLDEEIRIKDMLAALERMDVDSPEFEAGLEKLRATALAHNDAEELQEFPVLRDALDPQQQARLSRAVAVVEKLAPTRPHPSLTLGGENVLAGGVAAVVDRVRDLLSRQR